MSYVIETRGLTRSYQTYKKPEGLWNSVKGIWSRKYESKLALAPTDLKIAAGQIVGLVGANGAGKTTLLKLLAGLIHPTAGEASVLGYSPWDRNNQFLARISILLGQKNQLWWDLAPADSFDLLARIYGLELGNAKKRALELAEMLSCQDLLHVQLRRLSLGERMKMEIIGSLLHQPDVLFLDEPTIGLDIVAQNAVRGFLGAYVKQHKPTILLTSHYTDDIAQLSDRLLLISQGQIVYDGTVREFTRRMETVQKVTLKLGAPLSREISLEDQHRLPTGLEVITFSVPASRVGAVLSQVLSQTQILDVKIEEIDFEAVIHQFLAADARYRTPGGPQPV